MVWHFLNPHFGKTVGRELDLMVTFGGAEKWANLRKTKLRNYRHSVGLRSF